MKMQRVLMTAAALALLGTRAVSFAEDSPPAPAAPETPVTRTNEVVVSVASRADRDASGSFTYSYSVQNSDTSKRPVALWALELGRALPGVQDIQSPEGWTSLRCSRNPVKLCWKWSGQNVNALQPGYTLTGFSLKSTASPDHIRFYALNLPDGATGLDDAADLWGRSFFGQTEGPQ